MAKKGGQQQLQADIQNDDDLEKFLERRGLLVLDIYAEWCGPCLGMVGALKKIKLEIGGDNLHLAICKAEGITPFKRFSRKSEPTWLFVKSGKAVNIYFGTNVPKLMSLITNELKLLGQANRTTYELGELQPIEVQRRKVIEEAEAESKRIEEETKERKRVAYLTYVTDTIMDALPDMGVTLFGPQVNRDMFKKLQESADMFKIQCKDRKTVILAQENFDVFNFQCPNPLSEEITEQLIDKEVLVCLWKVPESDENIPIILSNYANALTKSQYRPVGDGGEEEEIPPILTTMDIKIERDLKEGEEWTEEEEAVPQKRGGSVVEGAVPVEGAEEGEEDEEDEDEDEEAPAEAEVPHMEMKEFDFGVQLENGDADEVEEEEKVVEEPPKKRTKKITIKLPPVWVPLNHRTHAALIYVFFRAATTAFLPPDPKPEPPHIIMVFDAYKKRDLIAHAERNRNDVPLYGFFTSDNPDEAKFIANSDVKYSHMPHSASDKLVFKVNKATSNTMLSLVTYGPTYVSPNTKVGADEAKKFFPETYKTAEQEEQEQAEMEKEAEAKGKKKKHETADTTLQKEDTEGAASKAPDTEAPTRESDNEQNDIVGDMEGNVPEGESGAPQIEGEGAPPDENAPVPPAETTDQAQTDTETAAPAPTDAPETTAEAPDTAEAPQATSGAPEDAPPPPANE